MPRITAADVRAVTIGRPPLGRRGYDPAEVDEFLARAAGALDAVATGRPPGLTAQDVHSVVFAKPSFRAGRGYDEDQVDELLDAIEAALR